MGWNLLIVFLAGGCGCTLRYLVSLGARAITHTDEGMPREDSILGLVPIGTLAVNVIGCVLIGLAVPMVSGEREAYRLALVVGLLGGFTTFSAFGHETLTLIEEGRPVWAGAYALGSLVLGLAGAALGSAIGGRLLG